MSRAASGLRSSFSLSEQNVVSDGSSKELDYERLLPGLSSPLLLFSSFGTLMTRPPGPNLLPPCLLHLPKSNPLVQGPCFLTFFIRVYP